MQPEAQPGVVALLAEIGFVQPLPGRIRRGNLGEIRVRPSQQVFHFADLQRRRPSCLQHWRWLSRDRDPGPGQQRQAGEQQQ